MASATGPEDTAHQVATGGAAGLAGTLTGWSWMAIPLGIGLASRVMSIVFVLTAAALNPDLRTPRLVPSANPLTAWDGQWYLSIAERGYHAYPIQIGPDGGHHDVAFFPGWPALIRVASFGIFTPTVIGVALANVLTLAALVVIWRVLATSWDGATATHATALLAVSPASFVLSMAYSEPLFLLLAGLAFLGAAQPGRRALATGLAMLTRVSAVGIMAAAAVRAITDSGKERRVALWTIAGGALALGGWIIAVAWITHDPLGLMQHGSSSWARVSGMPLIVDSLRHPTSNAVARVGVWAALLIGGLLALRRNRDLGIYAVVSILLGVLPGGFVSSLPRYALVAFPAFAGLASIGGRRWAALLVVVSVVLQAYFVVGTFGLAHAMAP